MEDDSRLKQLIERFCKSSQQILARPSVEGSDTELVLAVRLRDRQRGAELLEQLRSIPGVRDASLVLRDELYEM